jgi:hypothetical protein
MAHWRCAGLQQTLFFPSRHTYLISTDSVSASALSAPRFLGSISSLQAVSFQISS